MYRAALLAQCSRAREAVNHRPLDHPVGSDVHAFKLVLHPEVGCLNSNTTL